MGAGASADLPEKLSHEQVKNLCGDKYDDAIYQSIKDDDGNVQREQFISIVTDSVEKEVIHVFQIFCPQRDIDSRTFVKLCKEARLMNKKNFTTTDCDLLFQKAKSQCGVTSKSLNYSQFRRELLPGVATKKNVDIMVILDKIAQVEGPVLHGTQAEAVRFHDDKSTFTGAHAQGGPDFHQGSNKVQMENLLDRGEADVRGVSVPEPTEKTPVPPEHHKAAIRVQTLQRKKTAKKLATAMKEVKDLSSTEVNPDTDFDKPNEESDNEKKAKQITMSFSPTGELDSRTFIKLCKDAKLMGKKFTATDADLLFQKTKAKATAPGAGSYSSGVVHGKRVSYDVFRAVAVPLLAEKKGVTVDAIIEKIAECSGPTMTNTTTAGPNRFHDDTSTYTGVHAGP